MKKGFTMIELIFVIVILGILAAVAIPKLAATRDDANIAKGATEVAMAVADMSSYYTANGALGPVSSMTNVTFDDTTIDMNASNTAVVYPNAQGCISIEANAATGATGIIVRYIGSAANTVCDGIAQAAVKVTNYQTSGTDSNKSHVFGGSSVKW
ncbi:MAG: type II secretion system protein [Sulfurospirillaceae bacterium]|nr:type II secretion system protein [Sulfurospirillaceae bacterium]